MPTRTPRPTCVALPMEDDLEDFAPVTRDEPCEWTPRSEAAFAQAVGDNLLGLFLVEQKLGTEISCGRTEKSHYNHHPVRTAVHEVSDTGRYMLLTFSLESNATCTHLTFVSQTQMVLRWEPRYTRCPRSIDEAQTLHSHHPFLRSVNHLLVWDPRISGMDLVLKKQPRLLIT